MLIVKSNKKCYKMYDTVNFRLSGDCIDSCNYSKITDVLSGIQENIEVETGKCRITGNFNNYRIILSESSVFISGSLAKFYFNGENQSVLTRIATKDAIQMLQDCLNIPLDKAEIKRPKAIASFHSPEIFQIPKFSTKPSKKAPSTPP